MSVKKSMSQDDIVRKKSVRDCSAREETVSGDSVRKGSVREDSDREDSVLENSARGRSVRDNSVRKKADRNKIGIPELFLCFFKIGCFTFGGGWAIVAQMEQEFVDRRKLITKEELLEMIAVGRSLPGIMITNISMLFGYHVAGIPGGICTVVGIVFPAVIILSIITVFYNSFKDNYWVHAALTGIRAVVIPIIAVSAISLGKQALRTRSAVVIFAVAFAISVFAGVSSIMLILIAIAAALVWHAAVAFGFFK